MRRRGLLAWPLAGLLPGCAVTPPDAAQHADVPAQWLSEGGAAPLRQDWWQGFQDPMLAELVEQAQARNLDIRLAAARLQEARVLAAAERGAELPSLDVGIGVGRSRSISDVTLKPYFSTGGRYAFQAAYEIDLWGRLGALTKAAEAGSVAARDARDAAALSVAATAAASYIALRATDAQLELAQRTLASRRSTFDIIREREGRGYSSPLETQQAEAEWRVTAESIPQLETAAQRQERAIDVLLARVPTRLVRGRPLLEIRPPPLPASGLPSELLRRRPDIAGAEQQVIAADAQLHAARARLLPSLRLTGSVGRVESSILTGDPFTIWDVGGSVLAPIFHGGELRALAQASASRREQAVLAYQRVVLSSFAEVETQLANVAGQRRQLERAREQRLPVERSLRIATRRVETGYSPFLDQLLAERTLYAVDQNILQLHADLLIGEVGLFRALGGGWSMEAS